MYTHTQNSYVTRNVDKAIPLFQDRFNIRDFRVMESTVNVTTPRGKETMTAKIALGWNGKLQYELIQPISGAVDIYRDELPADDMPKFHHICLSVPDWTIFRAEVTARKDRVVLEGGNPERLMFLYVDVRDTVGHYIEYTWMTPDTWTRMGGS